MLLSNSAQLGGGASDGLRRALADCKKVCKHKHNIHHDAVRQLGLDWSPEKVESWNSKLPTLHLQKLQRNKLYPPPGQFICKDQEICDPWHHWIMEAKQADKWLKCCEPLLLDEAKLVHTVAAHEDTNFYGDLDILGWLEGIVNEAVKSCRNIWKEDAGHLSIAGFSAGARSKPEFHWAQNLIRKLAEGTALQFQQLQASAFALFWNMLEKRLPKEICNEWRGWISREVMPAMNPLWKSGDPISSRGSYEIRVLDETVAIHDAQLALPSGVMVQNYARAIHFKRQPHKWSASHTINHEGFSDKDGGHFYISAYGIHIKAAPDTLVIWQPALYHGTSLQRCDPNRPNPEFLQQGLSFVTSPQLPGIWKHYLEKLEKLEAEAAAGASRAAEEAATDLFECPDGPNDIYFEDEPALQFSSHSAPCSAPA
ncbi:hypothetical protein AN958_12894 [Leucoagaricus sp. SymC.cos]|nr:hypothetical protein AN958_12894 [Leucoagaricus sp. SymC.cos]